MDSHVPPDMNKHLVNLDFERKMVEFHDNQLAVLRRKLNRILHSEGDEVEKFDLIFLIKCHETERKKHSRAKVAFEKIHKDKVSSLLGSQSNEYVNTTNSSELSSSFQYININIPLSSGNGTLSNPLMNPHRNRRMD